MYFHKKYVQLLQYNVSFNSHMNLLSGGSTGFKDIIIFFPNKLEKEITEL